MTTSTMSQFSHARDSVRAAVTAIIHDDRETAIQIVKGFDGPRLVMILTALDLCAGVHRSWALSVGMDPAAARDAWAVLMLAVETTRTDRP